MYAYRLLIALAALLTAGCDAPDTSGNGFDPAVLETVKAPSDASCESRIFEGQSFTICPFDARTQELRLALKGADGRPLRSLAALEASLGKDAARVRFAMNAGMYDEEGLPIGHYEAEGQVEKPLNLNKGPGNFHMLPNGVFAVDMKGQVMVATSDDFANQTNAFRWATQSGPMLVIDNKLHPKFDANGGSRLIRNGVGVKDPHTAYFVISDQGVSFGRFARLFRDALGCPNALFLDGSVSSLWDPGAGRQDGYSGLGPMVVVLNK
jgi:uncharacterized protein YigE (DUF2233 family)